MPTPVSSITRMRATADADYARAGITSAEHLREIGADAAYLRLLLSGVRAHFVDYCMLVLGLRDRASRTDYHAEKATLRPRFDAIKAAAKAEPSEKMQQNDRDSWLDAIGVVGKKP